MALGRLLAPLLLTPVVACAAAPVERAELGRQLFEENWLVPAADDSPLAPAPAGDGLGPLFNGASCSECHFLGGVGGAGPNENNVEIVSLVVPPDAPQEAIRRAALRASETHPGFLEGLNVFLHRFGRSEDGDLRSYEDFRRGLRYPFSDRLVSASVTEQILGDGQRYQLARRNAPALFGAGRIDRISPDAVRRLAEEQRSRFPTVAGRVTDRGAGRFGWRGHVSSLDGFVRTACAEELGLRVRTANGNGVRDQPAWPVDGGKPNRTSRPKADMSEEQVEALVAFVRSLSTPRQVLPSDPVALQDAEHGRRAFEDVGCAVCHVPNVDGVNGIFSDLLLHDMGPKLADRVSAPLPPPKILRRSHAQIRAGAGGGGGGGNYSGGSQPIRTSPGLVVVPPSLNELAAATREFRTPPLWGVADSAPYLHDGRAETLDEAIRAHSGQAHPAAAEYFALPDERREQILAFLGTLRAPAAE